MFGITLRPIDQQEEILHEREEDLQGVFRARASSEAPVGLLTVWSTRWGRQKKIKLKRLRLLFAPQLKILVKIIHKFQNNHLFVPQRIWLQPFLAVLRRMYRGWCGLVVETLTISTSPLLE